MTDYFESNLDAQRARIVQAALDGISAAFPNQSPKVTAWCEGEYLAENAGDPHVFLKDCLGVDEVTLRVKINGARKGFVQIIWGNGVGYAISDFSQNLEPALKAALAAAEFLDV